MKTNLIFLPLLHAILFITCCGIEIQALADETVEISAQISAEHSPTNDFLESTTIDPNTGSSNGPYDVHANFCFKGQFNTNGTWGYYDLERKNDGTNVSHTMRIAGQAFYSPYVGVDTWPYAAGAQSEASIEITEDMVVEYIPDSNSDAPPASISFQPVYKIEGQVLGHGWTCFAYPGATPDEGWEISDSGKFFQTTQAPGSVNVSQNTTISTTVVGFSQTVNFEDGYFISDSFSLENSLGGNVEWQSLVDTGVPADIFDYEYYTQADSFDLRYTFLGFANPVDQNTNTIPLSKLDFFYVNKNDTSQRYGISVPSDTITLQAIVGTNSLMLQWPSYATNYQLEISTNLANGWCTNSLPMPIQSGPFLQVVIPTTNSCAFFRLFQTN